MVASIVNSSVVWCQHFQKTSLKLCGQCQLNFICSFQARGERKVIFGPGHMTKMAAMPVLSNNLLQTHWVDSLEIGM